MSQSRHLALSKLCCGVILLLCTATMGFAQQAQAPVERLQARLDELRALKPAPSPEEPFANFVSHILPDWLSIVEEHQEELRELPVALSPEDVLATAYRIGLLRLKEIPGAWSAELRREVTTVAGILCTIGRVLKIPKSQSYQKEMQELQPAVTSGAYERLLVDLAIRPRLLTASEQDLRTEGLTSVNDLFYTPALQFLRARRFAPKAQ